MKKQITKLISILLVSIFMLTATVPAITAFAALKEEAAVTDFADEDTGTQPGNPGDTEPPEETEEEEEEEDISNLSPVRQFLIGILENILTFVDGGKGAGGTSSFISSALNAIIAWLKK